MLSFEGQAKKKPTQTVFLLKEFSMMEIDITMSYGFETGPSERLYRK